MHGKLPSKTFSIHFKLLIVAADNSLDGLRFIDESEAVVFVKDSMTSANFIDFSWSSAYRYLENSILIES